MDNSPPMDRSSDEYKRWLDSQEQYYHDQRNSLNEASTKASESFDKYLVTLSISALGFSILYIEKVVPADRLTESWSMVLSWIFFSIALILILASFRFSLNAFSRERDLLDRKQNRLYNENHAQNGLNNEFFCWFLGFVGVDFPWASLIRWLKEQENPWTSLTRWFNNAALWSFFIGMLFLVLFCISNVPTTKEHTMAGPKQPANQPGTEKKGLEPWKPAVVRPQPQPKPQTPAKPSEETK